MAKQGAQLVAAVAEANKLLETAQASTWDRCGVRRAAEPLLTRPEAAPRSLCQLAWPHLLPAQADAAIAMKTAITWTADASQAVGDPLAAAGVAAGTAATAGNAKQGQVGVDGATKAMPQLAAASAAAAATRAAPGAVLPVPRAQLDAMGQEVDRALEVRLWPARLRLALPRAARQLHQSPAVRAPGDPRKSRRRHLTSHPWLHPL